MVTAPVDPDALMAREFAGGALLLDAGGAELLEGGSVLDEARELLWGGMNTELLTGGITIEEELCGGMINDEEDGRMNEDSGGITREELLLGGTTITELEEINTVEEDEGIMISPPYTRTMLSTEFLFSTRPSKPILLDNNVPS